MKTFKEFLVECGLFEAKKPSLEPRDGYRPVVSLLHHPIHGVHQREGYGEHHIIRHQLRFKPDDTEFEHTAHAHLNKSGDTLLIGHHHPPKDSNLKNEFAKKVKKHYSLPKGHSVKHYNIYTNKEI